MEQEIRSIYADQTLSSEEKSRRVFELLNPNQKQSSLTLKKKKRKQETECTHYERNCILQCHQCLNYYQCRFCHDENEADHSMDRFKIDTIRCYECQYVQSPSNECELCHSKFAKYYCDVCHLWTNDEIYHCNQCGLCRKGSSDLYQHCETCDACMVPNHKCRENLLSGNCTICLEDLFTTTRPIIQLPCTHTIHQDCLREYQKNDYRCPNCHKSIGDLTELWNQITAYINAEIFPEPYCYWKSEVQCVDCSEISITKFHYRYHQCQKCNSYNTKKLRSIPYDEESDSNNNST